MINRLEKLYQSLSKNSSVRNVFSFEDKEKILKYFNVENFNKIRYEDIFASLIENLKLINEFSLEDFDIKENRNVKENSEELLIYINSYGINYGLFKSIDNSILLINVSSALVIFICSCKVVRNVSKLVDGNLNILERNDGQYYRGISNINYKLIPSIYRDLKTDGNFSLFSFNSLKELYKQSNLIEKYEDIFDTNKITYDFCAFAQHSKSYSPLVDFTDEVKIALSFATTNVGVPINSYEKTDAGIFSLELNEVKTREKVSFEDIHVYVSGEKLHINAMIDGKFIFYCSYKDFKTEAYLIRDKTNDRMKYQKGCFLYFQRAFIVNGNLLMPINFGKIRKYKISANKGKLNKKEIYRTIIEKYHYYQYGYLIDPYKYFEESPF